MSIWRRAARIDTTQREIVQALRKAGYVVEIIRKPVDLAVRHPRWPVNRWMFAEAKTPKSAKDSAPKKRTDQLVQDTFCELQGIPKWTSAEQALREVAS